MAPYTPDAMKNTHFECGLPPSSVNPRKANFGFFMYAIMFIVADMTGLFFSLFVFSEDPHAQKIVALFAVIMAVAIVISMRRFNYA